MNRNKSPRLRFAGFAGEWEEKTLGENASFTKGSGYSKSDLTNEGFPIILYGRLYTQYENIINNVDTFVSYDKNALKSFGNEVIVPASGETEEDIARASAVIQKGVILGGDLNVITPNSDIAPPFLALALTNGKNNKELAKKAQGKSVVHLRNDDLKACEIYFPTKPEQTALGDFFRRLDETLAQERARLAKTQQLKRAMLAKLFPAHGETAPKLRFKGFSGDWERKMLGDLGHCVSGVGFPEREQGGSDGIPFFKVSDMNLSDNEVVLKKANHYVTETQIAERKWQPIEQLPCIFFAKVGAALLLNRKRLVNQPFLLDNNTMAFIMNNGLNDYFIKTLFDTIELPELAQTGALPSINAKDVENVSVLIPPTSEEQTAIGNFFQKLDQTLALQSAALEKLTALKKALLAAMLV